MEIGNELLPDVIKVEPLKNMTIKVFFADGTIKLHDIKPYVKKFEVFSQLLDPVVFNSVKPAYLGTGVAWNDDIDISPYDIWELGTTV